METSPFFTIIIPVKAINDYVRETVPHIQRLTGPTWELLIVPNETDCDEWHDPRIRIMASGRMGPAGKRDLAAKVARGEILAFLDDDSYPEPDLLDVAANFFLDPNVVALGGPAVTPPQDTFWQRVSGATFLSRLSGGAPERYVPVGGVREIDDWPSVNLIVRRQAFLDIGGFNSPYWPGEDTKLCLDLIKKTGKKILYVPNMIVWHHRRAGLAGHLRQVGAYGLHRGYFAKRYPETSRRLLYFLPCGFFLFCIATLAAFWLPQPLVIVLVAGWIVYGLALIKAWLDIRRHESLGVSIAALGYVVLSHGYYGARFLQGLFTRSLVSRLR